ncbi:hypothetical protein [Streptomyces mutabilis]|uniref:hypothetical protein n=1 Tax=Streptomyces mutabilis TaxID=67332 RepID=UPI00114625ED|nr:hypothetical protein [Streptomyces mutabilis]
MSHPSERPARVELRADLASSAYSKNIAQAVAPETRARAAEAAGALLSKLHSVAEIAAAKGAC